MSNLSLKMSHFLILVTFSSSLILDFANCLQADPCSGTLASSSCRECISDHESCSWTSSENVKYGSRCVKVTSLTSNSDYWFPRSKVISQTESSDDSSSQQLYPHSYSLNLRVKNDLKVPVTFKQRDLPVDLYFLIDNSFTMRQYKEQLRDRIVELSELIGKVTSDYKIGFGTFVDKPILPYARLPLEVHCSNLDTSCVVPYAFKNDQLLTTNVMEFKNSIDTLKQSANQDFPEGQFDALMQVMTCGAKIGWRENSRKIIFLATDAVFHLAGDGRLAGIIRPNDKKCHLDENMVYDKYAKYDYPSISEINSVSENNSMNIILTTVTNNRDTIATYQELSKVLELSSFTTLGRDANYLLDLVYEQYKRVTSQVKLVAKMDESSRKFLNVKISSNCRTRDINDPSRCQGIKANEEVTFQVTVTAKSCPPIGFERIFFTIENSGQSSVSQKMTFDTLIQCKCPCEDEPFRGLNICSNHGSRICGLCECDQNFLGRNCECKQGSENVQISEDTCKNPIIKVSSSNFENVLTCSGHGTCKCGLCNCTGDYIGDYCECSKSSCARTNGLECSNSGSCICSNGRSVCQCNKGFTGDSCDCSTDVSNCVSSSRTSNSKLELCSNRGSCICNKCSCEENCFGDTCQDCPTADQTCSFLVSKVIKKWQSQFTNNNQSNVNLKESNVNVEEINIVSEFHDTMKINLVDKLDSESLKCSNLDAQGCNLEFSYKYVQSSEGNKIMGVSVLKNKSCPRKITTGEIATYGASVLAAGLIALILWKVLTWWQDKNEFERFKKEIAAAQWQSGQNPMYKPSNQLFPNPAYSQK